MTIIVHEFMQTHFNHLTLRPSLFYAWEYGIRFEISIPWVAHEDEKNFLQIKERTTKIFNCVFQESDEILLVTDVHCAKDDFYLQHKPTNVYLKYVKNRTLLKKLQHSILPSVFSEDEDDDMVTHRFTLPCLKNDIRTKSLLLAISNEDFSHPAKILKQSYRIGYDIYLINVTRKIIYHLYDDRGCDVIASEREDLRPLYERYHEWILDYDRENIDQLFR